MIWYVYGPSEGVSTEADLSLKWEDGMVELKCSPPPPQLRAAAEDVAKQCPRMATLAKLLLKEDVFEALPWQSQVRFQIKHVDM